VKWFKGPGVTWFCIVEPPYVSHHRREGDGNGSLKRPFGDRVLPGVGLYLAVLMPGAYVNVDDRVKVRR
jgi:hypothetical protein